MFTVKEFIIIKIDKNNMKECLKMVNVMAKDFSFCKWNRI